MSTHQAVVLHFSGFETAIIKPNATYQFLLVGRHSEMMSRGWLDHTEPPVEAGLRHQQSQPGYKEFFLQLQNCNFLHTYDSGYPLQSSCLNIGRVKIYLCQISCFSILFYVYFDGSMQIGHLQHYKTSRKTPLNWDTGYVFFCKRAKFCIRLKCFPNTHRSRWFPGKTSLFQLQLQWEKSTNTIKQPVVFYILPQLWLGFYNLLGLQGSEISYYRKSSSISPWQPVVM